MFSAPFNWTEEVASGSVQPTSASFGHDFGNDTMNILVNWADLPRAIPYIVGYSQVVPNGTGGFRLSRNLPARNPRAPGMRATKITVTGIGPKQPLSAGIGTYGAWTKARIGISFDLYPYPMLPDGAVPFEYTCDIEFTFQLFDPPIAADAQPPNPKASVNVNGNLVEIRGHNAAPLPSAVLDTAGNWGKYYAVAAGSLNPLTNFFAPPNINTPVPTDLNLFYQYAEFNNLFAFGG